MWTIRSIYENGDGKWWWCCWIHIILLITHFFYLFYFIIIWFLSIITINFILTLLLQFFLKRSHRSYFFLFRLNHFGLYEKMRCRDWRTNKMENIKEMKRFCDGVEEVENEFWLWESFKIIQNFPFRFF